MKNKLLIYSIVLAGMAAMSSCNNQEEGLAGPEILQVQVEAGTPHARAMVKGSYLPDNARIGVALVAQDGTEYDDINYANVPYIATGNGVDVKQTWTCTQATAPSLSTSFGKVAAYYPYNESVTDVTALQVETDTQTDYMYATWYDGLYSANSVARLTMQHALSVIRVKLSCTDTSIPAQVSSITAIGTVLGSNGIINAGTGVYSSVIGLADGVTRDVDFTVGTTATETDLLVVPNETATGGGDLTIKVVAGGRTFTYTGTLTEPLRQGRVYSYALVMDIASQSVTGDENTGGEGGDNTAGGTDENQTA